MITRREYQYQTRKKKNNRVGNNFNATYCFCLSKVNINTGLNSVFCLVYHVGILVFEFGLLLGLVVDNSNRMGDEDMEYVVTVSPSSLSPPVP